MEFYLNMIKGKNTLLKENFLKEALVKRRVNRRAFKAIYYRLGELDISINETEMTLLDQKHGLLDHLENNEEWISLNEKLLEQMRKIADVRKEYVDEGLKEERNRKKLVNLGNVIRALHVVEEMVKKELNTFIGREMERMKNLQNETGSW